MRYAVMNNISPLQYTNQKLWAVIFWQGDGLRFCSTHSCFRNCLCYSFPQLQDDQLPSNLHPVNHDREHLSPCVCAHTDYLLPLKHCIGHLNELGFVVLQAESC